jgi:hypothetical protein
MVFLDPHSTGLSEMKLKLLYSLFQSEDGSVKNSQKTSLLQSLGDALESEERSVSESPPRMLLSTSSPGSLIIL